MLQTLLKYQTDNDISQSAMARKLKIPRSTWCRTVKGDIPIGQRIITAVLNELPQYTAEAMIYQRSRPDISRKRRRKAASADFASASHAAHANDDYASKELVGATK